MRVTFLETAEEDWDRILAVDLRGVFLCTKYIASEMVKAGKGGKIVNISSMAALLGGDTAYTTAKGGINSMTRELVGELAPYKININAICLGPIATPSMTNSEKANQS